MEELSIYYNTNIKDFSIQFLITGFKTIESFEYFKRRLNEYGKVEVSKTNRNTLCLSVPYEIYQELEHNSYRIGVGIENMAINCPTKVIFKGQHVFINFEESRLGRNNI